jgi:hypothetical protein
MDLADQKLCLAPSTRQMYDGKAPGVENPALANARVCRDILGQEMKRQYPHGKGIQGTDI